MIRDELPDNNSIEIQKVLHGNLKESQRSACDQHLCAGTKQKQLTRGVDVDTIVSVIYHRDSLSLVNEAYSHFNDLCNTHCTSKESMKGFELRFAANVS